MNTRMKPVRSFLRALLCGRAFLFLVLAASVQAGSAAWNLNPTSGDWNTAANWTPATVPDGPADVATFGVSNTTSISQQIFSFTEVNGIVFNSGASPFTITTATRADFTVSGRGITNNSGIVQ